MKIRHLALLSAFVPCAALIGGCGGGNGNGPAPVTPGTSNPTTDNSGTGNSGTGTPTTNTPILPPLGTPPQATIAVPRILLRLPGGEVGVLNLTRSGRTLAGELRVFNAIATGAATGTATGNSLAAGTYPVTGVLAVPTAFTVSNQATGTNKFTLTGNLPSDDNTNGSYSFTRDKFTASGTLLARNQSVLPALTPYRAIGDLQFPSFSSGGQSNFLEPPAPVTPTGPGAFNAPFIGAPSNGLFSFLIRDNKSLPFLKVNAARDNNNDLFQQLGLDIQIGSVSDTNPTTFAAGQRFDLTPGVPTGNLLPTVTLVYAGLRYTNRSGTLIIRRIDTESVAFELQNVVLAFPDQGNPISNITVTGTFEASGIQTQITAQ